MAQDRGVALVTGASSGIGKATARALLAAGFTTYASARSVAAIDDLARDGCRPIALDVTDEGQRVAAIRVIEAEHGAVTVLVNNAGYGEYGPAEDLDLDDVRRQFETNVFAVLRLSQLVLPEMRRAGRGCVINLSSVGGEMALPVGAAYHATKYAVEALSDVLRFEVAAFGIDVVLIQPGLIDTGFGPRIVASRAMRPADGPYEAMKASLAEMMSGGPVARFAGKPDDVARAIVKAATARRPRTRYKVTMPAHALPALRRWLPDRAWDAFLGTMFPKADLRPTDRHAATPAPPATVSDEPASSST